MSKFVQLPEFPLVGRENAQAELRRALGAAGKGVGSCVVVEGPAGIGKSRLLAEAGCEAAATGMVVAAGRATELDRVAPLTTLIMSLQYSRPPGLDIAGLTGQDGNRFWLVDRLADVISEYVRTRPLVVVLDDAHWADELTALAFRVLIPALSSSPVLWLLGRRRVPTHAPAQEAIDWLVAEGARQLRLGPLSDEAVRAFCANALGAAPDDSVLALAARSGGNPFLLEQVLRSLKESGQLLFNDGTVTVVGGELPPSFFAAVHERLGGLSEDARRVLQAGSVLGRPFTVHEASGLVGRSAVELVPAANEAAAAGTLIDTGSEFAFRHELIREAIYNSLSGPVRMALHREAALVAEDEGRSPVEVAEHLIRGGRKGGEQAVRVLRDAATQVAPSAPGTAADFLLRVLKLLGPVDPSRPLLIAEVVRLLASAGRLADARRLGERALTTGLDPAAEAVLLLGLAEALKHVGHNAAVVEYVRRALARPGVPEPIRAQLQAIQAHALLYVDDIEGASLAAGEAVEAGAATGEHGARVFGIVANSVIARARGQLEEAVAYAQQAVYLADEVGGEARQRHPRLWLARALAAADRFDDADAEYVVGQRESDELGTAWSRPLWHYYRAELRLAAGHPDEAEAEADAGVRVTEQLGALQLSVPLLALLARVAIGRSQMTVARRFIRKAERRVKEGVSVGPGDLTWTMALFREAMGRSEAALEILANVYGALPQRLLIVADDPGAGVGLVRIAQRAGARSKAEAAAAAIRSIADANPAVASLAGAAWHAEGILHGDLQALRTAVERYRSSPRPLARAAALEDTAVAEQNAGHDDEAVALFEEALALYVGAGVERDAGRVRKRLRNLGVRPSPRMVVVDGVSTRTPLTHSELRVVRLVADGLTNREVANRLFLSPHTVDSHLRHVFTKLGINSRVELTRQLMEYEAEAESTGA